MKELALKEVYKQLKFSVQIENPSNQKISKLWIHQNIAETFLRNNRRDSVWKHLMIQKQILKSFPKNNSGDVYNDLSTTYSSIGKNICSVKTLLKLENIDNAMVLLTEKLADFFIKYKPNGKEVNHYLQRYQELNDSLKSENSRATELIVNKFLKKKDVQFKKEKVDYAKGIVLMLILVAGLVAFLFWQNRKKGKDFDKLKMF